MPTKRLHGNGSLVSVVITLYDRDRFIADAIQSVFDQTDPDWEIILADDGGKVDLTQLRARFGPRLNVVRAAGRGPAAARNTGARAATGEWVLFFDDDDLLLPNALADLRAAANREQADWAAGRFKRIDVAGRRIGPEHRGKFESGDVYRDLIRGCQFGPPAVVLTRRSVFEASGGFPETPMVCEDWDLWLTIAREHPVAAIGEPVALYRVHGAQRSATLQMFHDQLALLERHRGRARPGLESDFDRAAALLHTELGDQLDYWFGRPAEARQQWARARHLAGSPMTWRGYATRIARSYLPGRLRRRGRPSADRDIAAPVPLAGDGGPS